MLHSLPFSFYGDPNWKETYKFYLRITRSNGYVGPIRTKIKLSSLNNI
jgi:hypothetical protein